MPLEGASLRGRDIQVAFDEDKVKAAPRVDDDGALSPQEEDELYGYYGVGSQDSSVGTADRDGRATDVATGRDDGAADVATDAAVVGAGTTSGDTGRPEQVGHDTSGPDHGRRHDAVRGAPARRDRRTARPAARGCASTS